MTNDAAQTTDTIEIGREYVYVSGHPVRCHGFRYRVLAIVLAVPSYQQQVLVEAIDGPDAGLLFVCSPWNFSTRYRPVEDVPKPECPEPELKVLDLRERGHGH